MVSRLCTNYVFYAVLSLLLRSVPGETIAINGEQNMQIVDSVSCSLMLQAVNDVDD